MQHIAKTWFAACVFIMASAHSSVAVAQDEQDASSAAIDATPRPDSTSMEQEQGWGRFGIGIKAGLTSSHFLGSDGTSEFADYTQKPAFTFGISGLAKATKWLSIQSDILFVSKGRRTSLDGALVSTLDVDYMELPVLARIGVPVSEHLSTYLMAGPAVGLLLKFQTRRESDGSATDLTGEAKRIEVSGVLGAGVEVALTRQHGLTLEARYDRSFTRFLENGDDVKNRVFAFMLGYQYSFSLPAESAP